jgi:phage terminase large subunit GpA-like protein
MDKPDLEIGGRWWLVRCPNCGEQERLYAAAAVRLTVPSDDPASLRLTFKVAAVDHACHQTRITVDANGEIVPDLDSSRSRRDLDEIFDVDAEPQL